MKIIIAPAKKMIIEEGMHAFTLPSLLDHAKEIQSKLNTLSSNELKALWGCNDQILEENIDRLSHMKLDKAYSPAIYSYVGLQYQYISANTLTTDSLDYLQNHLRILSGFYGVLKPFDAIAPYRLEMCQKLSVNDSKNLYDYWGDLLYQALDDDIIINLSSDEYSKCIKKYLKDSDQMITIHFGELINDKFKTKGTIAKMARGEMVRYMALHHITDTTLIKSFNELDFKYDDDLSDQSNYYFIRSTNHD